MVRRRELLVGDAGAIVLGGIVVRANDVTISNVSVVGGENGITIEGYDNTMLDDVSVSGAKLDGIHVRLGGVMISDCTVDMLGKSWARESTSPTASTRHEHGRGVHRRRRPWTAS